ncbi:TM0106 family RecB-like putative nuclease [Simiduia sp. 21SJ11W-1]|uniref:TM0106 family RecB-like putative nuclease n=1 Tax=Simiduia sp. 21SJ11W-1 TaxID=2909669 RepID=UPI0020A1B59C|nr:TM0106 family RecB-like putative nuclease [Simiduia sp. 21SJ11W-1]UTA47068.1 TM0106 family RecB-like putative nuclease [Simiduia sp. 21SJ11W-1]
MQQQQGQWVFAPSDLTTYLASPFASWMNRQALQCPDEAPERDAPEALMDVLQRRGFEHETRILRELTSQGLCAETIDGQDACARLANTRAAMARGVDVIFQGYLAHAPFAGYADFLIKVPGQSSLGDYHYTVWDTKLTGNPKPAHLVQLCCYADMLAQLQGVRPAELTVVTGDGEHHLFRTDDFFYYYRAIKQAFLAQQLHFEPNQMPDPAESDSWGEWSQAAQAQLIARDHLFQVANITKGQIKKLNGAGIHTLRQLADCEQPYIAGMAPAILARLKVQARAQIHSRQQQAAGKAQPWYEILKPAPGEKAGLALLPPASRLDVFFDIEGFPLVPGGLEYLWGASYFDEQGQRQFRDFWAHNAEQEKQAFVEFIAWVYARWEQDPSMHIYHYANYEIAACRKLMGRYGVCEHQVDQLLRNDVFVDLYTLVKGALVLGEPRYSIKNVEHLYRPARATDVGNGGDSVVVYERWRALNQQGIEGDSWQSSPILNSIRAYNIDDSDSTQELVEWLREQQSAHNIPYLGRTEPVAAPESDTLTATAELRDALTTRAEQLRESEPLACQLCETWAGLLEFHRREAKPLFWRLFDRLGLSEDELADDLDCLAGCTRTEKAPFKHSPRARNLTFEYRFEPAQAFKAAHTAFYVLGVEDDAGKPVKANLQKSHSQLDAGIIALQSNTELPARVTLVPDEFINPEPVPSAIAAQARAFLQGELGACAITDFLNRSAPRLSHELPVGAPLITATTPEARLAQIIERVQQLDASYLTLQGPPGAGKSYTGSRIIGALLAQGARVGIASNSHKAINNLLLGAAKYCRAAEIRGQFFCSKATEPEFEALEVVELKNNALAASLVDGCVVGTTAWGFAREDMAGQLDYLFIDEAGQVSVANLVGMSRSAKNLVLMGDQMQLGQPSQGSHPGESGLSVLDYLLHDAPTISPHMGVFLGTTYRMHSRVNDFISRHIYAGQLQSHPSNDARYIAVPAGYRGLLDKPAGITFVPVHHMGNTQAACEEVEAIVALTHTLLGRTMYTGKKEAPTRKIDWQDILFVAPYNMQVRLLQQALGEQARVGSVDKFQGQEAPVVMLSMCASDANESPRGAEFLFDRHRINVAVSRAQCLAVVVGNPALANTRANQVQQLPAINLVNALMDYGS